MFATCAVLHLLSWTKTQEYGTYLIASELLTSDLQEEACRELGYDGLAIVNTPEQFAFAIKTAQADCFDLGIGLFIGLHYDEASKTVLWDDGTSVASDIPGATSMPIDPKEPFGRIKPSGALQMGKGKRCALCGNHTYQFRHVEGTSESGKQPDGVSSILSSSNVNTYEQCVSLCGRDVMCRAAEFNFDLFTCRIFGPHSYTGLVSNNLTKTFLRVGF